MPRSNRCCAQHELPAALVQAAIDVGPRRLQSAPAARRPAVPPRAVVRRLPARVRIPDRRRSLPPHHQSAIVRRPSGSTPRSCRTTSRSPSSAIRGRIDGEHPSLIGAIDRRRREDPARDRAGRDLQRPGRFQQRPAAGRQLRGAVREDHVRGRVRRLRPDPRRRAHRTDGRNTRRFRWTDPATGKAGYYDENGRSLKRFLLKSPLQFQPRVTSGFSLAPPAPGASHGTGRISASTTARRDRDAGRRGRGRRRRVGRLGAAAAGTGQHQARRRARDLLPAPVVVRPRHPRRRARRAGAAHRPRRRDRHRDRAAPRLPAEANGVFVNPRREHREAAAGRADPGAPSRDLPRRARIASSSSCHQRWSPPRPARPSPTP